MLRVGDSGQELMSSSTESQLYLKDLSAMTAFLSRHGIIVVLVTKRFSQILFLSFGEYNLALRNLRCGVCANVFRSGMRHK